MPIVQRPLASVIARDRERDPHARATSTARRSASPASPPTKPCVDSEVSADGGDPAAVHGVTIGFNAVAALAAGKVDAATGFWNAEGVELQQRGIPIREFRVDEFGARRTRSCWWSPRRRPCQLAHDFSAALNRGYSGALGQDPRSALEDLLDQVSGLDAARKSAQLGALDAADAFAPAGPTPESRGQLTALTG